MNFKIIVLTNVEVKNRKYFTVPPTHQVSKSPSRKSLPRSLAPSHPAPQTSPSRPLPHSHGRQVDFNDVGR